ncbi:MAG TPA: hypothetical protein HPP87_14030 [Planctomycetes bacterium]|nr:hypothetical protein [Planctomycetota bacterium]
MRRCSVTRDIEIVRGDVKDYHRLSVFHYRRGGPAAFAGVYSMKKSNVTVGVIVYTMPSMGCELRNIATGGMFEGLDRKSRLKMINRNIRCISRVIIEPRFRGLGLAKRLVAETMPLMNVPVIEAMAVMGNVHPFFERAGMKAYRGPVPARCAQLTEALSLVGIEEDELIEPRCVQAKLDSLTDEEVDFIEAQVQQFLASYGRSSAVRRHFREDIPAGLKRTRFILSKLTARPVYYIWFNPQMKVTL